MWQAMHEPAAGAADLSVGGNEQPLSVWQAAQRRS